MATDSYEAPVDGRRPPERVPKSERILNLIAVLLRADEPVPVTEILGKVTGYDDKANRESLMRRFERDKKVLRDMGIPVEHAGPGAFGVEGYRISRDSYFLDEVKLNPEAGGVLRALYALAHQGGGDLSQDLRSALIKLGFLVEGYDEDLPLPKPVEALDPRASEPIASRRGDGALLGKNLETLSLAIYDQRRVRFRYYTLGRDVEEERVVEPYGLGFGGQAWDRGAWYLVGRSVERDAERVFKVQRILTDVRFASPEASYSIPTGFRVREHLGKTRWEYEELPEDHGGEGRVETSFEARVSFPAPVAAELRALVPSCKVLEAGPDRHTLAFTVRQRRPFLRFLLRYVEGLEILGPEGLESELRDVARAVLARYRSTPSTPPVTSAGGTA
jgi:proteasome accessory factor B